MLDTLAKQTTPILENQEKLKSEMTTHFSRIKERTTRLEEEVDFAIRKTLETQSELRKLKSLIGDF